MEYHQIEELLIIDGDFRIYQDLPSNILELSGLYCIRTKQDSLPLIQKYQTVLSKIENRILYIGEATQQSLSDRLKQEIEHKKPGTFFRSIGCALGYQAEQGCLYNKKNKNNYNFSTDDTKKIIDWLFNNIEISIVSCNSEIKDIEKKLIKKYYPLLNTNHNPRKLKILKEDRENCRELANMQV